MKASQAPSASAIARAGYIYILPRLQDPTDNYNFSNRGLTLIERFIQPHCVEMALVTSGTQSALLDLPTELRNTIYELAINAKAGSAPDNIEVLEIKQYAPDPTVTHVNHQVRDECFGIFRDVTASFCAQHTFYMRLGLEATDPAWRQYVLDYSQDIPGCINISRLDLRIEGSRRHWADGEQGTFVLTVSLEDDGDVAWRTSLRGVDIDRLGDDDPELQSLMREIFQRAAQELGTFLRRAHTDEEGMEGYRLQLPDCVRTTCRAYEEVEGLARYMPDLF